MVAAGTPGTMARTIQTSKTTSCTPGSGCLEKATAAQRSTAATEPQVPGPGLRKPMPKKVATFQAQRVFLIWTFFWFWIGSVVELSAFIRASAAAAAAEAQVFEDFGIEDRRADLVRRPRPICRDRSCGSGRCRKGSPRRRDAPASRRWGSGTAWRIFSSRAWGARLCAPWSITMLARGGRGPWLRVVIGVKK